MVVSGMVHVIKETRMPCMACQIVGLVGIGTEDLRVA